MRTTPQRLTKEEQAARRAERLVKQAGLSREVMAALHVEYHGGNGPSIAYAREGLMRIFGKEVVGDSLEAVSAFLGSSQCPKRVMNTFVTLREAYGYDPSLQVI